MCLREYSEEEIKEMFQKDGYDYGFVDGEVKGEAKGRAEGRAEGRADTLLQNVRTIVEKKGFTVDEAMDMLDIPAEDRVTIKEALG